MRNKKAFTLIELLAVIVILAVIALIAVPQVLKILNNSRRSAAEDSAYGVLESAESFVETYMLEHQGDWEGEMTFICLNEENKKCCTAEIDTTKQCSEEDKKKLDIKGKIPTSGTITVGNDGEARITESLRINNYSVVMDGDKVKAEGASGTSGGNTTTTTTVASNSGATIDTTTQKTSANVEQLSHLMSTGKVAVAYLDPTNLETECNAESTNVSNKTAKQGCMKWYIYSDAGDNYKMILDHNTTANKAFNTSNINSDNSQIMEQLATDTTNWDKTKLTVDLISAGEVAGITNNGSFNESTLTNWFYLDSNNTTQTATSTGASAYAWMYDYTYNCTSRGCNTANNSTYGYWTKTPTAAASTLVWFVSNLGRLYGSYAINTNYGVRPVITLSKSLVS